MVAADLMWVILTWAVTMAESCGLDAEWMYVILMGNIGLEYILTICAVDVGGKSTIVYGSKTHALALYLQVLNVPLPVHRDCYPFPYGDDVTTVGDVRRAFGLHAIRYFSPYQFYGLPSILAHERLFPRSLEALPISGGHRSTSVRFLSRSCPSGFLYGPSVGFNVGIIAGVMLWSDSSMEVTYPDCGLLACKSFSPILWCFTRVARSSGVRSMVVTSHTVTLRPCT